MGAKTGLYAIPVLTPDRKIKRQNGRRMKGNNDPAFTITANDRHGVYNGRGIRRLTPVECERLQGFPDNWTVGISDTARYKCLGNAVTVNVVREIMHRIVLANKGRNQNNHD
jgi:DNA (cytosine-5)-methyltransferase 1